MKKRNTQEQITRSYHTRIRNMLKGQTEKEIFDSLSTGKNTYLRLDRLQSSSFDVSWIDMIENVIFDLGEIIANPRLNTKQVGNLVPVELARKTNAESVQHLASHTQYIKEIDEYGNVIPSKIMNIANEDDLHTYENRFIATFVRRLVLFIEKRYEFVSKFAELRNEEVLMFKNKSIVNGAEVEIETKVKVSYKNDDEMALKSNSYIERIAQMREYILYFYNSPFMRQLKTERDVRNPILQTNIIRKNPKYHHCYEVYRFIETYDRLGVNYKVDENYSIFDEEELNELNHTLFANYITLRGKDISKNHKTNSHVYKPRILTSSDDEQFIYGPLLKGPIEFVRTDAAYQEYLDSKIRKDLPLHPTKKEKEYYADEYAAKAENKEDLKQKQDLLKRKNKELARFEKAVEKILEEREKARLELERLEKEIIKKEENDLLTAMREEIIAASKGDQEQSIKNTVQPVNVVPESHPYSEPVTYDEATLQIWPQLANAPLLANKPMEIIKPEPQEETKEVTQEVVTENKAPVYVEMSHPYSEPVTYEEATLQIWPQLANQPAPKAVVNKEKPKAKAKKAAPKVIPAPEQVEQEPVPAVVPVEMSHPYSEPVTYEQATLQIWPQLANQPAPIKQEQPVAPVKKARKVSAKKVNKVAAQSAKEEPRVIPQPAVVPVEMSHPYSEPVTYEEATLQIWPQLANQAAPMMEEAPVKKAPRKAKKAVAAPKEEKKAQPARKKVSKKVQPVEEPIKEEVPSKKVTKKVAPKAKPVEEAPVSKQAEQPSKKEAPVAEPKVKKAVKKKAPTETISNEVKEAPQKEAKKAPKKAKKVSTPSKEEKASVAPKKEEIKPKEEPKKASKPVSKKPVAKKAPVSKEKKTEKKKPAPKKKEVKREKIPGKFIVKTNHGYYVNKNKYSVYKDDAKIFDDFNLANDIKKERGGKVVKI